MAATLKRVFRHLPFLDAALTVDLNLAQDVAGAQAGQLPHQRVGEGIRRLIGLERRRPSTRTGTSGAGR